MTPIDVRKEAAKIVEQFGKAIRALEEANGISVSIKEDSGARYVLDTVTIRDPIDLPF